MSTYILNGRRVIRDSPLETLDELLLTVERGAGADRQVVTAVRFDGVDDPSFRARARRGERLRSFGSVELTTMSGGDVIASCIQTALTGLRSLARVSHTLADDCRRGDMTAAREHGADLVTSLRVLAALAVAIRQASELVDDDDSAKAELEGVIAELRGSTTALAAALDDGDAETLAEILEHGVAASLPQWTGVLGGLAPASASLTSRAAA
jgi:hypothetical protein